MKIGGVDVDRASYRGGPQPAPWPQDGRRPVVLQVLSRLSSAGSERAAVDVAAAVAKAGGVSLVASSGGPMVADLIRAGARHIQLPLHSKNPAVMAANIFRLSMLILRYRVNIVHARSRNAGWSALQAARRTGAHYVTTFHDLYSRDGTFKKNHNEVMVRGDRVIAVSNFIADHIQEHYNTPEERIRVVYRGIDTLRFDPDRVSADRMQQLSSEWRLPDGVPIIMLPARLVRWKGHELLIEAITRLRRRNLLCLMYGFNDDNHGYHQELEMLIQQYGVGDKIHIYNECTDMPAAYMLADVVVSASTSPESFSRVLSEAQAMGRPVVATDHGSVREQLQHGRMVWLTPAGNSNALADAIGQALDLTPSERRTLSREAIANIRARFSKEVMCQKTLQVYWELVQMDGRAAIRA